MVDVRGDHRGERDEVLGRASLTWREEVRQQRLGVREDALQRLGVASLVPETFGEALVGRGHVEGERVDELADACRHVRAPEDRLRRQLPEAHPQPRLVLGEAPLLGEAVHVVRDHQDARGFRPRERQRELTEGPLREVAGGGAELHPHEHRTEGAGETCEQRLDVTGILEGSRRRGVRPLCLDDAADRRGPRIQGAQRPRSATHRLEGRRTVEREAGGVGDVELRHPPQLLEADPRDRIGIGLLLPVGGDPVSERPRGVEPCLLGARCAADDPEEVLQQTLERVVRRHEDDATARWRARRPPG